MLKGADASTIKTITTQESMINRIKVIQDKFANNPKFKEQFGVFNAKFKKLMSKFKADQDVTEAQKEIDGLLDYLYTKAGKQVSDGELKIARDAWLPILEGPSENAEKAIEIMLRNLELEHKTFIDGLGRRGIIVDMSQLPGVLTNYKNMLKQGVGTSQPTNQGTGNLQVDFMPKPQNQNQKRLQELRRLRLEELRRKKQGQ